MQSKYLYKTETSHCLIVGQKQIRNPAKETAVQTKRSRFRTSQMRYPRQKSLHKTVAALELEYLSVQLPDGKPKVAERCASNQIYKTDICPIPVETKAVVILGPDWPENLLHHSSTCTSHPAVKSRSSDM